MVESGLEGVFHLSRTRRVGNIGMGGVVGSWDEGRRQGIVSRVRKGDHGLEGFYIHGEGD